MSSTDSLIQMIFGSTSVFALKPIDTFSSMSDRNQLGLYVFDANRKRLISLHPNYYLFEKDRTLVNSVTRNTQIFNEGTIVCSVYGGTRDENAELSYVVMKPGFYLLYRSLSHLYVLGMVKHPELDHNKVWHDFDPDSLDIMMVHTSNDDIPITHSVVREDNKLLQNILNDLQKINLKGK